jgi:hypothetical protein
MFHSHFADNVQAAVDGPRLNNRLEFRLIRFRRMCGTLRSDFALITLILNCPEKPPCL